MADRSSSSPEPVDPYQEERVAHEGAAAMERVIEQIRRYEREFLAGLPESRDFSALDKELFYTRGLYEDEHIDYPTFVVEVFRVLNKFAVPLTRSMMEELGIGEFSLRNEDFDDVCLDFINAKSAERILVAPESIPDEMDELPMSPDEIGDSVTGTLEQTKDGHWYLRGKGKHGWLFAVDDAEFLREAATLAAAENRGKQIVGTVQGAKVRGCRLAA